MTPRRWTLSVVCAAALAAGGLTDATAHGPRHPNSPHREQFVPAPAPARGPRRANPSEAKRGRLNARANVLKEFAQAVVTDLGDRAAKISQTATQINRQRSLRNRNMDGGYGMRRWSDEKYDQILDKTLADADTLLAEYKKLLGWVEVQFSTDGMKLLSRPQRLECLAGRREVIVFEVANSTGAKQVFRVTGSASPGGRIDLEGAKPVGPRTVTYVFASLRIPSAGDRKLKVSYSCGRERGDFTVPLTVKPSHKLLVNIVNAATGKPCAARAWVKGADGRYTIAQNRPVALAGGRKVYKFGYANGQVRAVLPRGPVEIKIQKGFEYEVQKLRLDLSADETVTVKLTRWVDMPAKGWYSGDTHVHWVKTNWYENGDPKWLSDHSRAEDLWVNNNLILKHWWKNVKTPEQPRGLVANRPNWSPVGPVRRYSTGGRIVWTSEEYRNDEIFGHMVFLRISKLIEPVSTGFMGGPAAVHWPPNSHTYDKVRQAGGISIPAHDVNNEVPIQAILGKMDAQDAHNTGRYYDLLNCGFRVPLSCGSDYPAAIMGFARVYVYCGEKLEYGKWVDNLAAGRTFVSSGAMVFLEADGKAVGDTIKLAPGETREIAVKASALCKNPLARLEIVHNGQVVKRVKATGDGKEITFAGKIAVDGPGWIAARTFAPGRTTWWAQPDVAHTSPIYITRGDERLVKPKSVKNLIKVIKGARAKAAASRMYASDQQKQAVLDYFDNGVKLYEKLLARGGRAD